MTDEDNTLTFPIAISKIAVWSLGALFSLASLLSGWLCLSTLALRDQVKDLNTLMLVMAERSSNQLKQQENLSNELQTQRLADASISAKIEAIQLLQAEHGWRRKP